MATVDRRKILFLLVFLVDCCESTGNESVIVTGTNNGDIRGQAGTIYFNNPHLLAGLRGGFRDESTSSSSSGTSGGVNLSGIGGAGGRPGYGNLMKGPIDGGDVETDGAAYVQEEAKILASHLRQVTNEELAVTRMQAILLGNDVWLVTLCNRRKREAIQSPLTTHMQKWVDGSQYNSLIIPGIEWGPLALNVEMGTLDSLPFLTTSTPHEEELLQEMSLRMGTKLTEYVEVAERNRHEIEQLAAIHNSNFPVSYIYPCCVLDEGSLRYNEHFGVKVSTEHTCDIIPPSLEPNSFLPGQNLSAVFEQNYKELVTLKWQYFLSVGGASSDYPASEQDRKTSGCRLGEEDSRHKEIYWSTVLPQPKYVLIVLDHGNSLSAVQLAVGKAVARDILSTLSHRDKVGLIALAGDVQHRLPDQLSDVCLGRKMAAATYETKLHLTRFIDGIVKSRDPTNHTLGFVRAFEMIRTSRNADANDSSELPALIVYISRGLLNSLTEAKTVLSTIARENQRQRFPVAINTFVLIDDNKPIMYEKRFLQDVADQNFKKYDVSVSEGTMVKRGVMLAVNSTKQTSGLFHRFYSVLEAVPNKETHFSLPYWDPIGRGLIVSLSQACFHHGQLVGVVGLDIHLADIVEDATYFHLDQQSYAFIVNSDGYVIMHPSFARISFATEQPMETDIVHLESWSGFHLIRKDILQTANGRETLVLSSSDDAADSPTDHHPRVSYTWKRVPHTPYIICIVRRETENSVQLLKSISVSPNAETVYHRLDLVPAANMCHHLKQLAVKDLSTLYLSPGSFLSPFEYLSQEETKRNVQSYMAYLSDGTKLIANPGLKPLVRSDVAALVRITSEWRERFSESSLAKYIVRRYVATPSGAFLMHPGAVMDRAYDAPKRPWYMRAMEYPGQVVITAPYLDVGGAGYIVTVSHTVFEGKPAAMHSVTDGVVAVMGVDFTLGYFYRLLMEFVPLCNYERMVCFLMDDLGYLIAHPGLIEPNGKGPVEQQHITHKDPLVANDILNHKGFVTKKVCNSLSDRTIQRFYQFNASVNRVLSNLVHGEHCSKYQITPIPGTNIFLGIINQTCDMVTAFCPCSMVDRLCLNCHRMEQNECECPCECPLETNLCSGHPLHKDDVHPSCPPIPDETRLFAVDPVLLDQLPPCFDSRCSSRVSESDCFGVVNCEWCQVDSDGTTLLKQPYCTTQRKCFGGVLGAQTPYADEVVGLPLEEILSLKSSPVGPVAGGIMGCFLVLLLGVYCYRQHSQRNAHVQYSSTVPDTTVRMSHLDEIDEPEQQDHYAPQGHSNHVVYAAFEARPNVSPYHMNAGYRRPTGGDSDHGYSTMTPHEDSEYQPSVEPIVLGKDRYRPGGATQSVASSSRASSPAPPPPVTSVLVDLSQTVLPLSDNNASVTQCPQTQLTPMHHRNSVLAPVQVHMVDSH